MTGGTGFVGTYLVGQFIKEEHKVTILTPPLAGSELKKDGLTYLTGNPTIKGPWQEAVRDHDVIINLAGASIFSRWTEAQKIILRSSRIDTTRHLVEALPDNSKHITFFSTSAVGYYGFHEDEELVESSPSGAVNLCSPNPVRNKDLGKAIGKVLHRPSFLPAPGFMIELILGEFGSVLLKGQRVIPRHLLDAGFKFRYPDIEAALKNVIAD